MPAMSAAVGSDVEALCSKCGDVWHVVFAKDGEKIVRVQCKQCSGYHRYKSPGAVAAAKAPKSPRAPRAPRDPVERFERASVQADLGKDVVQYRASAKYTVADRVEHPTFGTGTVEIVESRPLSKTKRWNLVRIVTKAPSRTLAGLEGAVAGSAVPAAAPAATPAAKK